MWVVTKIYSGDVEIKSVSVSSNLDRCLEKFDIVNTDNKKSYSKLSIHKLYKLTNGDFKSLLGAVVYDNYMLIISVNYATWKLLDYIKEIKYYGVCYNLFKFLKDMYPGVEFKNQFSIRSDDIFCLEFDKGLYVVRTEFAVESLDDDRIFWLLKSSMHCNLHFIYDLIYSNRLNSCEYLFLVDDYSRTYKLEINKDIIRLLTKSKMLGDKLCW